MDWHKKSIRMGTTVILLAVMLRLYATGMLAEATEVLGTELAGPFLLYLETGRVVHPTESAPTAPEIPATSPQETVSTTTPPATTVPREPVTFSREDAALIRVWGTNPEKLDLEATLEAPLDLQLVSDSPTVLILHTHATESFTQAQPGEYTESSAYRTLDTDHNMVSIGSRVAELLEAAGIHVIQSEELHDYPNYTGAYQRSRVTMEEALAQYPDIRLVLDLHRDSAADDRGRELDTSAQKDGLESARLMPLMSVDHDHWQENLNIAVKLTAWLEKKWPGITRGILTRNSRYNQELHPGALLIEVGAAGNTHEEALRAAEALAEAIIALGGRTD